MAFNDMLLVATVLASSALPSAGKGLMSFEEFVERHGRTYQQGSAEYASREAVFNQRLAQSNLQNGFPDRSWTAGVNKLFDWTEEELRSLRGWDGAMRPGNGGGVRSVKRHHAFLQQESELPKEKIWSNLAMAQRVRNQGDCGSCWAIAVATVLEGHAEIFSGKARTFSAQQIVACTPNPRHCGGDGGCKGATAELAMDWVLKNGCAEEDSIPYTGSSSSCTMGSATADMAALLSTPKQSTQTAASKFGMTGWETLPKKRICPIGSRSCRARACCSVCGSRHMVQL